MVPLSVIGKDSSVSRILLNIRTEKNDSNKVNTTQRNPRVGEEN